MDFPHLIIGDGIAGMSAARALRARCPTERIVVMSNDPQPFYFRAALTNFIEGQVARESLWGLPHEAWSAQKLERFTTSAAALDSAAHTVTTSQGEAIRYRSLLIASGTRAAMPDAAAVPGTELRGIHTLRSLADANAIIERAATAKRALVLGGGILGLEVAAGLVARNLRVTLVNRSARLMDRVVDARAAELIRAALQTDGVDVRLGNNVRGFEGDSGGVRAAVLQDGSRIDCTLVLICIGVRPNTEWLHQSGVQLDRGHIVTDAEMRVPGLSNVFAAGDVASVHDATQAFANPTGLWQPARRQGTVAGSNMAGGQRRRWQPGYLLNATRAWGINLVTCGASVEAPGETLMWDEHPHYAKVLIRDQRLAGFLLLGDRSRAVALHRLMNLSGAAGSVLEIRDRLLDPRFDLAGWVARQREQKGVHSLNQTTLFAPLATAEAQTPVAPDPPAAAVQDAQSPSTALTLDGPGGARRLEQRQWCLGGHASADIRLPLNREDGDFCISAAGAGWMLSRNGSLELRRNGVAVLRPVYLADLDVLECGGWRAVIRLQAKNTAAPMAVQAPQLELLGRSRHRLRSPVTTVGSAPDSDVLLPDLGVAAFHAQLQQEHGHWFLVDCGGQQGTWVNGERLAAPRAVQAGDVLEVGTARLQVVAAAAIASHDKTSGGDRFYLVCEEGPQAPRAFEAFAPCTLGRDGDVALTDPLASRVHLAFHFSEGRYWVEDRGSSNGSWLNEERLSPGARQPVADGQTLRVGRSLLRFSRERPVNQVLRKADGVRRAEVASVGTELIGRPKATAACTLTLLDDLGVGPRMARLEGSGPHVLGRGEGLPLADWGIRVLSREHAQLDWRDGAYWLKDLGSSHGSFVNGERLGAEPRRLKEGDEVRLAMLRLGFSLSKPELEQPASTQFVPGWFDEAEHANPLEARNQAELEREVRQDLDSCIGCHLCMEACPLPQASLTPIADLNAYAEPGGYANPAVRSFVQDCTQCHACVPVCPANVKRSRIVLWNKQKQTPELHAPVVAQVGSGQSSLSITLSEVAERLIRHSPFRTLSHKQLAVLLAQARFRRLLPGETLIEESRHPDALWLLLEGELELSAALGDHQQRLVLIGPGKTAGEAAVLSDQTSDVRVSATQSSLVVGFRKYSLHHAAELSPAFERELRGLYLQRSSASLLRRMLPHLTEPALEALLASARTRRLEADADLEMPTLRPQTQALVLRGFLKELRPAAGGERCTNYLRPGNELDLHGLRGDPKAVRYQASTVVEVLFVEPPERLATPLPRKAVAEQVMGGGRGLLVIDTHRCVDCDNCVDACGRRHGHSRIDRAGVGKQVQRLADAADQTTTYHVPGACYHCEDPKCLLCYVDGIVRLPTGEISIVSDRCIGCGACSERCPYGNIQMVDREPKVRSSTGVIASLLRLVHSASRELDPKPVKATPKVAVKCDLCAGYKDGPACVRACPTGAAQRRDADELVATTDPL